MALVNGQLKKLGISQFLQFIYGCMFIKFIKLEVLNKSLLMVSSRPLALGHNIYI